ncbi:hypothetical protein K2173_027290 [Erythroxylum novogranatense]|uniref:Thioredoxin domain-containing protein n=1 Tax=Erythroxylum novogranatense TaxID=1862640 RepID=A0AAV8U2H1_9ROSI|nr:hypothetical protein K2173_027290 [Erythroxylum novogranatense]
MGSIFSFLFGGGNSAAAGEYASDDISGFMVVDFAASWCGPCKLMEPAVCAMAAKFADVQFTKIDVDKLPEVAQEFGVQAMPTFVLVKRGKEVDRVVGAKKDELEKRLQSTGKMSLKRRLHDMKHGEAPTLLLLNFVIIIIIIIIICTR